MHGPTNPKKGESCLYSGLLDMRVGHYTISTTSVKIYGCQTGQFFPGLTLFFLLGLLQCHVSQEINYRVIAKLAYIYYSVIILSKLQRNCH